MNEVTVFLFCSIASMTAVCGGVIERGYPNNLGFSPLASPDGSRLTMAVMRCGCQVIPRSTRRR